MNKDKMLAWAEALESGQYEQTGGSWGRGKTDKFHIREGFCCLLVALNLEGKQFYDGFGVNFIQQIYDITDEDINNFIFMNDKQKLSFPEIAVEIRKMVEE